MVFQNDTYITKQKITTAVEAAVSADEYVLLHESSFIERSMACDVGAGGHCFDACPFMKLAISNLTLKQVLILTMGISVTTGTEKDIGKQIVLC